MTDQETAAAIVEHLDGTDSFDQCVQAIAHALAAEREACAGVCDKLAEQHRSLVTRLKAINQLSMSEMQRIRAEEADGCADAIRTRGR